MRRWNYCCHFCMKYLQWYLRHLHVGPAQKRAGGVLKTQNSPSRKPLRRQAWAAAAVEQPAWKVSFPRARSCLGRASRAPCSVGRRRTGPVRRCCPRTTSTWRVWRKVSRRRSGEGRHALGTFWSRLTPFFSLQMCILSWTMSWTSWTTVAAPVQAL